MGNRRVVILVVIVVIAGLLAGAAFLLRGGQSSEPAPEDLTPQAVPMVFIVVATNNLDRGTSIQEGMVEVVSWPQDRLPPYYQANMYYEDPEDVYGLRLRTLVPQGMPLMRSVLTSGPLDAATTGSEEALSIPPGKRAVAVSVDFLGGVAWVVKPGDRVDVVASWLFFDIDDEFLSLLPNEYECTETAEGIPICRGQMGRMEILPSGQTVMVMPSTQSAGMYAAQLTIQDAQVLLMGPAVAPAPAAPAAAPAQAAGEQPPPPTPTPIPSRQAVVLVMDVQDAVILKALVELQADIDLVLRGPNDQDLAATAPVTLEYIMNRYGIEQPPKLPYVGAPPLSEFLDALFDSGEAAVPEQPPAE